MHASFFVITDCDVGYVIVIINIIIKLIDHSNRKVWVNIILAPCTYGYMFLR